MGFKMNKRHDAAIERIKELDATGHGFKATPEGETALKKLEKKGPNAFQPVQNYGAKALHAGEVLAKTVLEKRFARCNSESLCFVSLRPLNGKEVKVYHAGVGSEVSVLPLYA